MLDFGSARQYLRERSQNLTAVVIPGFAPWEQYYRKGKQGPWTDVYACAATLYFMLTAVTPPDGAQRMVEDDLEALEVLLPGLDVNIAGAIMKGLSINPELRPQTTGEFQSLLQTDTPIHIEAERQPQAENPVAKKVTSVGVDRSWIRFIMNAAIKIVVIVILYMLALSVYFYLIKH